jgi:hypothetical protein
MEAWVAFEPTKQYRRLDRSCTPARASMAREVKSAIAASSRSEIASFDSNFAFNVQTEPEGFAIPRRCPVPNSEGVSVQPMDV